MEGVVFRPAYTTPLPDELLANLGTAAHTHLTLVKRREATLSRSFGGPLPRRQPRSRLRRDRPVTPFAAGDGSIWL